MLAYITLRSPHSVMTGRLIIYTRLPLGNWQITLCRPVDWSRLKRCTDVLVPLSLRDAAHINWNSSNWKRLCDICDKRRLVDHYEIFQNSLHIRAVWSESTLVAIIKRKDLFVKILWEIYVDPDQTAYLPVYTWFGPTLVVYAIWQQSGMFLPVPAGRRVHQTFCHCLTFPW